MFRIGQVSRALGLSADTLRYYDKLNLLSPARRDHAGRRLYSERNVADLRFIKRAQQMNFSLREIAELLELREHRRTARDDIRQLMTRKLIKVDRQIQDLEALREELSCLVARCWNSDQGCPIIEAIERDADVNNAFVATTSAGTSNER